MSRGSDLRSSPAAAHWLGVSNVGLSVLIGLYFFFAPIAITASWIGQLRDVSAPPAFAGFLHERLTPRFERWARERVASGRARELGTDDVAGTEWPVFGSVFYLWATEALEEHGIQNAAPSGRGAEHERARPSVYAEGAVEAAAALVADPGHAQWVRDHWGEDYLERENLFYRQLLIAGLSSHARISGSERYLGLLREQTTRLADELDASPFGILDDYPGEAYSVDMLPTYVMIRRADRVLGTDHSEMLERARRAFSDARVDSVTGLPAYRVDAASGEGIGPARGVGMSYMLIWAPELWPDTAKAWYERYRSSFWQERAGIAGFREFAPAENEAEWFVEVDAGPVIAGFGTAASGFGVGAARSMGRRSDAFKLGSQALAAAWPLPDGTLVTGRLLSNAVDAPYLAEAVLLCMFTRTARLDDDGGPARLPPFVFLPLGILALAGCLYIAVGVTSYRRWRESSASLRWRRLQVGAWASFVILGVALLAFGTNPLLALGALTLPLLLPRGSYSNGSGRTTGEEEPPLRARRPPSG